MAKFYGKIGFAETINSGGGVWKEEITEREYFGDVLKNNRRNTSGESIIDNLTLNNEISVLADPYADANFQNIKYISWMGSLWKVTNITIQRPRLILSIGGVYNGPTPRITESP